MSCDDPCQGRSNRCTTRCRNGPDPATRRPLPHLPRPGRLRGTVRLSPPASPCPIPGVTCADRLGEGRAPPLSASPEGLRRAFLGPSICLPSLPVAGQRGEAGPGPGRENSRPGRLPPYVGSRALRAVLDSVRSTGGAVGAPQRRRSAPTPASTGATCGNASRVGAGACRYLPGSGPVSVCREVSVEVALPIPRPRCRYLAAWARQRLLGPIGGSGRRPAVRAAGWAR
jgi:hypothetical protein